MLSVLTIALATPVWAQDVPRLASPRADKALPAARLLSPEGAVQDKPAPAASAAAASAAATPSAACAAAAPAVMTTNCHDGCGYCGYPTGCAWFSAEYLLWWTKGDRLPPLLTTSPAATPLADAGVLGKPGTRVLFGDERVNDDVRSGGRFTLGAWVNEEHTLGVEGNFFFLAEETTDFRAASDGIPILARPFFNVLTNAQDSLKVAFPGLVSGSFEARATSELWGADIYVRHNIYCGCCCRVDLLAGYRFASLDEDLDISETEIAANPNSPLFGIPIVINEGFGTRNDFHGGQLGIIAEYSRCRTFVRFIGKLALGGNCRSVDINGNTRVNGFAPDAGGFLALPSNIGHYESSQFAIIPEVNLTVGYEVTERFRVMMGYTFIYWTDVARPGDQIDLAVNTTQPPLGAGLRGPARPAFNFNDSDFWAQGLSFGVEFRY